MCFLIIHIIIFRITLAYYLLKLDDDERKARITKRLTRLIYIDVIAYSIVVLLQAYYDCLNDRRLDHEYQLICMRLKDTFQFEANGKCAVKEINPDPNYFLLVPELTFALLKLGVDAIVSACGVIFYLKFRKLKKHLDGEIKKR